MRLLLDTNVDLDVVHLLQSAGHDVLSVVRELGGHMLDADVLTFAEREHRIVISHDRDFGDLAIHQAQPHAGIIYLRLPSGDAQMIARRIHAVLERYGDELPALLVVTDSGVRVRR